MSGIDIYRMTLLAVALAGLICMWRSVATPLLYFTVQTTIMVVAYFLWQLSGWGQPSATLGGALAVFVTITFLVAHFLLGGGKGLLRPFPNRQDHEIRISGELLLHYVLPAMTLADWFLCERAPTPKWTAPLLWLTYPILYVSFTLVRGAMLEPGTKLR